MNKKFVVRLSEEERPQLESLVAKGTAAARKLTRARILLKADCGSLGPSGTDLQISDALDIGPITVPRVRQTFVEGGSKESSSAVPCRADLECWTASRRPT